MEERNELNDIILNKGGDSISSSRKIIFAVAILTVILIVVIMIMKGSGSNGTDNLPQAQDTTKANLPPEPPSPLTTNAEQGSPLFEPVEIVKDDNKTNDDLDKIAKKLKEESLTNNDQFQNIEAAQPEAVEPEVVEKEKTKPVVKHEPVKKTSRTASGTKIYIQVGSFTKYEPNKKFLSSIKKLGYTYSYHKVQSNGKTINKVLVGPFSSDSDARSALKTIRKDIEPGAFVTKK